jgi:hypothetical protein
MAMGRGWGTNPSNEERIFLHNYGFCGQSPLCKFGQMTNSSTGYIYVRGGGRYIFRTDRSAGVPTLRTADYTVSSETISVLTARGADPTPGTGVIAQKGVGTVGSATLPMYLNNGTFTACTASSLFGGLANSGNTLSITVAGQNRTLTVAYATSAGSATSATTATTATKLGSSTIGSATLPMYLNAGTPTACTAASIFSGFSVSGKTLSATIAGQARSVTISNATYADMLTPNSAITFGASGLQYFNLNGTAGTTASSNVTPTSAWYHILRMNHANTAGYLADIAVPLNDVAGIWWRQVRSGTNYGWYKILDSNNWSSYCAAASHTHSYLPLSGGTLTGAVTGTQFIASDWLRSTGNTGWYHNTYGGGIYMIDSTWIRTYNSKNFYCNAQVKCGTLVSDGAATMSSSLSVSGALTVGSSSANATVTIGGATLTYNATTGYLECNKSIKLTSGDYIA